MKDEEQQAAQLDGAVRAGCLAPAARLLFPAIAVRHCDEPSPVSFYRAEHGTSDNHLH